MEKMMKQMGIKTENIDATEVIIKTADKNIIVSNPHVTKISMHGKDTFQVVGNISEKEVQEFTQADIDMIKEQTGASEEEIIKTLDETKDIAETILKLKK